MNRVWTIELQGGEEFGIQVPSNPAIYHNGRYSVHHVVLDQAPIEELKRSLEPRVSLMIVHGEVESNIQTEERQRLLGSEDDVYPTVRCLNCFWFDPRFDGYCSLEETEDLVVQSIFETQYGFKAKEDVDLCPIGKKPITSS